MRKVLLASHGRTASGIKSTVQLFLGNIEIECIDAYIDDEQKDYTDVITKFIVSMNEEDEAYVFTDIVGGSVHQKVISEVLKNKKKNLVVIANMNVAIVIELLTSPKMKTVEEINCLIKESSLIPVAIDSDILLDSKMCTVDEDSFLD